MAAGPVAASGLSLRGRHLTKASFNQQGQRIDGRLGIRSVGPQSECRTVYCSHRQQVQDAFAVDDLVSLQDFDLGLKRAGQFDEGVRGAGVKALRIDYGYVTDGNHVHDGNSTIHKRGRMPEKRTAEQATWLAGRQ